MEKVLVPAPFRSQYYTLEEIDEQLTFISNIIVHGSRRERANCFVKANEWLDKRLELKPVIEDAS